ncbi:MAG: hypothetical protein PHG54_13070 [Smithellaceae bacterium]|nr:hypothetical protein [Syntrophaceae bacterium]MDD4242353.1 hypothetical protein [Smithellaceae bacterium]NLX52754.1 hypothetical protein [Deltaproteobacteria bacterium]
MKKNGLKGLLVFIAAAALGLAGCAAPGIYSVNMGYDAQRASVPSYLKPDQKALQSIISVAEFSDTRKIGDPLVIGRVIEKNGVKVLVLPKTTKPTEAMAQGVRAYLRRAGYNVSGLLGRWDLREQTIPQPPNSRLLIGGAIEELEVDCRRAFPTNTYTTKIRLTLYLADTAQKKILYRSTVEATTSLEHALFSEARLGEQASVALGDAIEKLFEKHELSQQISELLRR